MSANKLHIPSDSQSDSSATNSAIPPTKRLTGLFRLKQIVGDSKAIPPIDPLIPVSKSSWFAGVRKGKYPPSQKLGERTTVWRGEDIQAVIDGTYAGLLEVPQTSNKIIRKTGA